MIEILLEVTCVEKIYALPGTLNLYCGDNTDEL